MHDETVPPATLETRIEDGARALEALVALCRQNPALVPGSDAESRLTEALSKIAALFESGETAGSARSAVWNLFLQETDDFAALRLAEDVLRGNASALFGQDAPQVIAIGGLSGSGKSTIARLLSFELPGIQIRADAVRKHLAHVPLRSHLPPEAYSEQMSALTYSGVFERARLVLDAGATVLLDAVFHSEAERKRAELLATMRGLRFYGLWCSVAPELAEARLQARRGDVSDADTGILKLQAGYDLGVMRWQNIDTARGARDAADEMRRFIGR